MTTSKFNGKSGTFEEILEEIGGFGRFQFLMLVIVLGLELPAASIGFITVFTGVFPDYWYCNGEKIQKTKICECNGTLSTPTPFNSVVEEWNLACSYGWVSDMINSVQMMGMIFGALCASQFADWYGRKYSTLSSALFLGIGSIISAIAPNPYIYAFGRVVCGAGFSSVLNLSGIYAMEFLPIRRRSLCTCAGPYGWAVMLLAIVAYYVRPWRTLAWITTSPLLIFCPLLLIFVPESPRFLIRQGKLEEATKVLNFIAKVNGRQEIELCAVQKIAAQEKTDVTASPEVRASYFDLFRQRDLRSKTICLAFIWFSWGLVYYGLYFNIKNIPGDLYVGAMCMGLADAIGFPSALLIMDRFGRRKSVVVAMTLGAVVMVTMAGMQFFLDINSIPIVVMVTCTLAKFFLAVGRSAVKCFTGESYPTDIRSIGMGVCSVAIALGGALCPQVVFWGSFEPCVPFLAFAVVGLGGSFFSFFITETSGKPLEESISKKCSPCNSIIGSSKFLPTIKHQLPTCTT